MNLYTIDDLRVLYDRDDMPVIREYNMKRGIDSPYAIQTHMTAAPFDGDPYSARVILLMNNPGYYEGSVPTDHTQKFPGWPLAGLHAQAREDFRNWYSRPFGALIHRFGPQTISQQVAIVQINPWASRSFDGNLELPSRACQFNIARQAVARGAIVVIGRGKAIWRQAICDSSNNVFEARNPRNPTLSLGGLGKEAYDLVCGAISA